jgi:oligopeptidase A
MFIDFKIDNLKDFPKELDTLLNSQKEQINNIAANATTYQECIKQLDNLNEELDRFFTPLSHLNSVLNSKDTQTAYEESIPLLSKFSSFVSQNEELYKKICSLKGQNDLENRVLELEKRDFALSGANLNKEDKKTLEEINLNLSNLSNQFSQNLLDATNSYELIIEDAKDVEGITQSDLEQAKIDKNGKTCWRFTLQMPSYIAYLTYGPNRSIREKLYKAYNTRAPQNQEIIDKLLELKQQKAKLLGFSSYAEYALQSRDATNEDSVLEFLTSLLNASKEQAKKDVQELKDYANKLDNLQDLQPYDVAYYSEKLKKEKFNFDESQTKPYFELNRVLDGMLNLISKLFNVKFVSANTPTWHESVKVYDILEDSKTIARIYFDLEARESKRGGAWMHNWQSHYINNNKTNLASAFVVANFAPSSKEQPSLLRHDDVVTLFHEMGHAIHHLFSKVPERSVSGVEGIAWDVVEFPSQFLENFAYEAEILKEFGYHYKTNEPISNELLTKIKSAKNYQAAMGMLRQIEFALFDFKLHQKLYKGQEVNDLINKIREDTAIIKPPKYVRFEHGFAHIFAGGYAAGYYSYKWAEVFSADAFFECLDNGAFNLNRAKEYKEHILQKGSSKDMSTLYKEWLNKQPQTSALIKLYEIKDEPK